MGWMMDQIEKFESGGYFGLLIRPLAFDPTHDDLGSGGAESIVRFGSAEAREYFIQAHNAQKAQSRAVYDLECLRTSVRQLVTPKGRVRRKALLELVARIREGQ